MNILSYLTPSFEEFVDAPVGADQLAHNSAAPGAVAAPATAAPAEAPADNLEIPESAGPALVASADEVQAAAVVEDPGHSEAEAAAQQASDANTAVIEQAQPAPAESGTTETTAEEPAATDAPVEETTDESAELGGDTGETTGLDDSAAGGDELGGDASGDDSVSDAGGETAAPTEETTSEDGLGDESGESTESGDETGGTEETTEVEEPEELEEDGLGETEGSEEGGDDGLGDGAESGSEETGGEAESEEAGEEETETEGEETSGEEESEESSEEEGGSEEESESEESSESEEGDEDDGVDLDIPDVDTETTADDVDEAEEEAKEAVAEDEELEDEIVDTSKSVAELEDEEVAVEEFIGVLQHGIRTKNFSAQTVALAQSKLLKLSRKFDRESPVIPSMEDYGHQNLGEYYTNSLESFSSFLKKIKHVRDRWMDSFAKSLNEKMHLKAVETQVDAINKALDVQILRVKELTLDEAVTIKVPAPLRGEGGPIKAVTKELQWLGEVSGVFSHDRKWFEAIAKLLAQAAKEGDSTKVGPIVNKALKVALPSKSYPASVYDGSNLAHFSFERVEKKATGSLAQDMANLGERAVPGSTQSDKGTAGGTETFTVKKADLVKMLQLAKVLIGLSRGTANAAGKGIIDSIGTVNQAKSDRNQIDKAGDKKGIAEADKALDNLVTQFWQGIHRSTDNYSNFQWHIVNLADHLVHTVQKVKGSAAK